MDWNMVGALGEILGAGAVVITLAYLSNQVRTTVRISKAEAWRSYAHRVADLTISGAYDPAFRQVLAKVLIHGARRSDLSEDERMLIGLWYSAQLNVFEQVHREVQVGVLPPEALHGFGDQVYRLPYFRETWPIYLQGNHSEAFRSYIDREYVHPASASEGTAGSAAG